MRMRTSILPLAASLLIVACTDPDPSVKEIQVDNRADTGLAVRVGAVDYGVVAPATMTAPREVGNGALELRVDGARLDTLELGSDNVSGLWTLTIDHIDARLFWGLTATE